MSCAIIETIERHLGRDCAKALMSDFVCPINPLPVPQRIIAPEIAEADGNLIAVQRWQKRLMRRGLFLVLEGLELHYFILRHARTILLVVYQSIWGLRQCTMTGHDPPISCKNPTLVSA